MKDEFSGHSSFVSSNQPLQEDSARTSNSLSKEFYQLKQFAGKETRLILFWKLLVILSILCAGGVVVTFTYLILKRTDVNEAFILFSNTIQDSFKFNVRSIFEANRALGNAITAAAMATGQTFPYVSVPTFEVHGYEARKAGGGIRSIVYAPVVNGEREQWIDFSQKTFHWLEESKEMFDRLEPGLNRAREPPRELDPVVWQFTEDGNLQQWEGNSIFLPSMYSSPPPLESVKVPQNINLLTAPDYKTISLASSVLKDVVFSKFITNMDTPNGINFGAHQSEVANTTGHSNEHPHSIAAQPVYKQLGRRAFSTDIGGYVFTVVAWDKYLTNLLPRGVSGIVVVLRNSCDQAFTYEVMGQEARLIGNGDLHDPHYDGQKKTVTFAENYFDPTLAHKVNGHCEIYLDIYPSKQFEDEYVSDLAFIFALVAGALFVVMAIVFSLYDKFVQNRNTKVLIAAAESRAFVSSLFPSNVRDRLMAEKQEEQPKKQRINDLEGFLFENGNEAIDKKNEMFKTKPIADLFPQTTILFGDIVGFTKWSSTRQPEDVFMLLETIYHAFDEIAKRRRVYKVETVGDCYVAVCGLPDPCKGHAVKMARFARDMMHQIWETTTDLALSLGADTNDLTLRIGLHSGPVTAGVLRGQRSRFQLFGDTMNTASRMESTGRKDCIQISQDTADLIIAAGKEKWVIPREDLVFAKGKGEMQTYFLEVSDPLTASSKAKTLLLGSNSRGRKNDTARESFSRGTSDTCSATFNPGNDFLQNLILEDSTSGQNEIAEDTAAIPTGGRAAYG